MLLILIVTLAFSAYTYGDLYTHINEYINMYINLKNKKKRMRMMKMKKKIKITRTITTITTNNELLTRFLADNKLKPVYLYGDLHLESTKCLIQKDTSNLSGIYLIFNKITGDFYVGSASTNRFFARFSNHLLY